MWRVGAVARRTAPNFRRCRPFSDEPKDETGISKNLAVLVPFVLTAAVLLKDSDVFPKDEKKKKSEQVKLLLAAHPPPVGVVPSSSTLVD
eukprot:Skav217314  [mRNA]  locus=scaffold3163:211581:213112:+ [translate_table: standard]